LIKQHTVGSYVNGQNYITRSARARVFYKIISSLHPAPSWAVSLKLHDGGGC
jgi:hypothetical protein